MAFSQISLSANKTKREPVEAGTHIARCISVIDFGTQEYEWQGEKKQSRQVYITFEIPGLTRVFDENKGEQPCVIGKKYTISMHEKSNLLKDMVSWLGSKKLDGDILGWLDKYVIGETAFINVIHREFEGSTYANIASISPLPKGVTCPPAVNTLFKFDLEDFNQDLYDSLYDWQKEIISKSPEYKNRSSDDIFREIIKEESKTDMPF
jgi:hypothetical protein